MSLPVVGAKSFSFQVLYVRIHDGFAVVTTMLPQSLAAP